MEGFRGVLTGHHTADSELGYLKVEQSHWLQTQQRPVSLCHVVNDAIDSRLHVKDLDCL